MQVEVSTRRPFNGNADAEVVHLTCVTLARELSKAQRLQSTKVFFFRTAGGGQMTPQSILKCTEKDMTVRKATRQKTTVGAVYDRA